VIIAGWGAATDTGNVRSVNEDSYMARPPVFVVADGMGGHAAGDVASRLAVQELESLTETSSVSVTDALHRVDLANQAIVEAGLSDGAKTGMGTTLTGIVAVTAGGSEHWMVFNVGDSRVYRLAGGKLSQLTTDHSEAEEMVAEGTLTREGARSYRRKNVVTRSLGTDPAPVPDSWVFPPEPGERFIICSDGLTNELDDAEIARLATATDEPQRLAEVLVRSAVDAGGRDNVTVLVVDGLPPGFESDVDGDTSERPITAGRV
jgi:serine/threonine protein phosphatase PrpC